MPQKLSVLDLSPLVSPTGGTPEALRNTLELAQLAERLGYTRYWLAEHHNMPGIASVAPEILIGHVADATERIRVGAGGIMLPNHTSLKVAETFKLLEAVHPGRIDLGLGRAPGTDARTAQALRRGPLPTSDDDFPQQLDELMAFDSGTDRGVRAVPIDVRLPPIWLLGSSTFSAHLAAEMGLPFAYAHHIHPHRVHQAMLAYRSRFKPSKALAEPYAMLTVNVVCADTAEIAAELGRIVDLGWIRFLRRQSGPVPDLETARAHVFTPEEQEALRDRHASMFLGTPADVHEQISTLAEQTKADEVMVTCLLPQAPRRRVYELLADAFGLKGTARS